MKLQFLITCFIFPLFMFGQTKPKKEFVLDEKGNTISVADFKSRMLSQDFMHKITEDSTSVTAQLFPRREKGIISNEKRLEIIKELKNITGVATDPNNTIVINFYFNQDLKQSGVDGYSADVTYKSFFKRNKQYSQFFITQKGFAYKENNVYEDNGRIEKLLFTEFFGSGNYIIIQPDGKFLKHNNEYVQSEIPKLLKA